MAHSGRQGKGQACTIAFTMLDFFFLQAFLNSDGKKTEGILSRLEIATVLFLRRLFSTSSWSVSGHLKLILMNLQEEGSRVGQMREVRSRAKKCLWSPGLSSSVPLLTWLAGNSVSCFVF